MLRDRSSLDLEALAARIPATPGASLLLSGSFAAGLAHPRSDVDVHVVGGEAPACDLEASGLRVQLTRVPDDAVHLARSLDRGALESTSWSQAYLLSDRERWELLRLVTAHPIRRAAGHDWIGSDTLRRAAARIQIGSAAHRIARAGDDIRGLLAADESEAARDLMRHAERDAAIMTLAAIGDLAANERLVLPRLRRSWLDASDTSWLVAACASADGDLGRLPDLQGLTALVQLVAWDAQLTPDAVALVHRRDTRRWTRSPHFWLVRRPDAVTVADSGGHGFRLPRDLALIWTLSESGDVDAIVAATSLAGARLTRGSVESGLARLVDLTLIEPERR